jgi:hypothetical protein
VYPGTAAQYFLLRGIARKKPESFSVRQPQAHPNLRPPPLRVQAPNDDLPESLSADIRALVAKIRGRLLLKSFYLDAVQAALATNR